MRRTYMLPATFPVGTLLCVLVISLAVSDFACGGSIRAGIVPLDVPPSPAGTKQRGQLIRARPFGTAAALKSASRNYRIFYNSESPDGRNVVVSGTVAIPAGN